MVLNPENYCIPRRHRLFGQTTKQPLNYFEPGKPWKYKQLWVLRPDPSCLQKCVVLYNFSFYVLHPFIISNTFISNANASNCSAATWGWTFAIILIFHQRYHPKIIGHILKNKEKNKWVCFHEVTWLAIENNGENGKQIT